jgi:hypothetical protein
LNISIEISIAKIKTFFDSKVKGKKLLFNNKLKAVIHQDVALLKYGLKNEKNGRNV